MLLYTHYTFKVSRTLLKKPQIVIYVLFVSIILYIISMALDVMKAPNRTFVLYLCVLYAFTGVPELESTASEYGLTII